MAKKLKKMAKKCNILAKIVFLYCIISYTTHRYTHIFLIITLFSLLLHLLYKHTTMSSSAAATETHDEGHYKRVNHDAQVTAREAFYDCILGPTEATKSAKDYIEKPSTYPPVLDVLTSDAVDGKTVQLPLNIYATMGTILNMIEDINWAPGDDAIPLVNVTTKTLENYVVFVNAQWPDERKRPYHGRPEVDELDKEEELDGEVNPHLSHLNEGDTFDLIMAINFLDCKLALNTICAHVAGLIKNKSPDEIKAIFKVTNDMEEEARKKNEIDAANAIYTDEELAALKASSSSGDADANAAATAATMDEGEG